MKRKILAFLLVIGMLAIQGQIIYAYDYNYEDEPNNTMATADKYNVYAENTYVYGTVNSYDDEDYFKLKATMAGTMDIRFNFDKDTSSNDIDIDYYIYDSKENRLLRVLNSSGSENFRISVQSGDFVYVRVEHNAGSLSEPYRIKFDIDQ